MYHYQRRSLFNWTVRGLHAVHRVFHRWREARIRAWNHMIYLIWQAHPNRWPSWLSAGDKAELLRDIFGVEPPDADFSVPEKPLGPDRGMRPHHYNLHYPFGDSVSFGSSLVMPFDRPESFRKAMRSPQPSFRVWRESSSDSSESQRPLGDLSIAQKLLGYRWRAVRDRDDSVAALLTEST